jgi:hypothetical protein
VCVGGGGGGGVKHFNFCFDLIFLCYSSRHRANSFSKGKKNSAHPQTVFIIDSRVEFGIPRESITRKLDVDYFLQCLYKKLVPSFVSALKKLTADFDL